MFYFHIRRGDELRRDLEGTDLPSVEEAHEEAVVAAREMLAQRLLRGEPIDDDQFEITDEAGAVVDTLPFRSVLMLKP
ncbi:MAG TPA: hypothetical protein VHG11_09280 [Pseudorhizobium sp.]|nr:hypothetical protein [Pseudorhizobium sp.]